MNSGRTTHCLVCGTLVTLDSVIPSLGRCANCHAKGGRSPLSRIPIGTVVWASFFPGFVEDLTSWKTEIHADGSIRQTIDWYEDVHARKSTETRTSSITHDCLLEVLAAIEGIDRLGIAHLNQRYDIDDAETVAILAPELGFHASISPYTCSWLAAEEEMPERARAGLKTFRSAWDKIESVSPYTTSMHWKQGRT